MELPYLIYKKTKIVTILIIILLFSDKKISSTKMISQMQEHGRFIDHGLTTALIGSLDEECRIRAAGYNKCAFFS